MFKFFSKKKEQHRFDPDEVFIDSLNLSGMDTQQMEGVIEKPIHTTPIAVFKAVLFVVVSVFSFKLVQLQIVQGQHFSFLAEKNLLRKTPLFAERGVIRDRNGIELAWNEVRERDKKDIPTFPLRKYIEKGGFGHLLGYVRYPQKDKSGFYWAYHTLGEAGVEKKYNDILSGENGSLLFETNALGEKISENLVKEAIPGKNIDLSIDAKVQNILFRSLEKIVEQYHFQGGAAAIMDVQTGELLALVTYPEFDANKMTNERNTIQSYFQDTRKPFLHRAVSGLYPPGSTVKPFIALAALHEGIITPRTTILSTGKIEIPNPYNPSKPSVYRDWKKGGHGVVDVKKALAESVNTFFYAIGGGYQNQKGLGIQKIDTYLSDFAIGKKTGFSLFPEKDGVIPSPAWKKKTFSDERWRLGDTYISSIGQFGFLVSPLEMLRSVTAIANRGTLITPVIQKGEQGKKIPLPIPLTEEEYQVVTEGMREVVTQGTARNINFPYLAIAAKTGTAQVGKQNAFFDSWIIGFFPYAKPRYSFVLFLEKGEKGKGGSASLAFRDFIQTLHEEYPEFFSLYLQS